MTSQPIHYKNEDAFSSTQAELLELLLHSQEDFYPWNLAEPQVDDYLTDLECGFFLDDWQDEDIKSASQVFFNQLHECWETPSLKAKETLQALLTKRFAGLMPNAWLEAIANQAQHVFSSNLSFADQLVLCVQPLLPSWAEDDLLVLARPLAYTMRGSSAPNQASIPGGVHSAEWTELSPIEQVRISLAAAHSALLELQNATSNPE